MPGSLERFFTGARFTQMKSPDKEAAEKWMMRVRDKLRPIPIMDFQAVDSARG